MVFAGRPVKGNYAPPAPVDARVAPEIQRVTRKWRAHVFFIRRGPLPANAVLGNPGLGISSIEERARLIEAQLVIDSAPGRGTRLEVIVPVDTGEDSRPDEGAD